MPNAANIPAAMSAIEIPQRTPWPPAVRAVLAEAGDRTIDDPRLAGSRLVVVNPQLLHRANAHVLEHDVGPLEKPKEQVPTLRVLQIDLDALLVAVQVDEVRRLFSVKRRTPLAGDVAAAGRFDLDDGRAEIGEHGRREGSRQRVRHVDYRHIVERHRHWCRHTIY
jgi:hypothetical protein